MNRWSPEPTLVVLAKEPRPGRAKTRLGTAFSAEECAALAAAAIADTFDAACATHPGRVLAVWDGDPAGYVPSSVPVVAQVDGGLDERIEAALAAGFAYRDAPVVLIGMDTPQVGRSLASLGLDDGDTDEGTDEAAGSAVFGPASDGGFWAIGLTRPSPGCVRGVPMSQSDTGERQLERLRAVGLRVVLLPALRDVDTPADAAAIAADRPDLRFSRLHAELTAEPAVDRRASEQPA
jgi:glycosyltransferase A (GT-A) superfamily protein (DUF2064 family)